MKAIVQPRYGSVDVLELREVDRPPVADDEVLVRVHAASVHPDVWHVLHGLPYFLRVMGNGLVRPRRKIPGTDMSGRVESIGEDVVQFAPGDEVFGETLRGHQWKNGGAFAEYVAVRDGNLARKPPNVTFEQAASVPTSGLIAYRALRDEARLREGERVLINGAGGGVGTIALQIAKAHGAHVTAVDSAEKLDLLRSLGADEVVDYTKDDFTTDGEYDLIFDVPGNRTFTELERALSDNGRYVLIGHDNFGESSGRWFGSMGRFMKLSSSGLARRKAEGTSSLAGDEPLQALAKMLAAGDLKPQVDSVYPLAEAAGAILRMGEGRVLGKIVLVV